MREKTDEKCYKSTPAKDLEDRIMNSNIAKSEAEWWAKEEIERLRGRLALIAPELEKANFLDNITRRTNDKTCFEGGRCPLYGECYSELWCRGIKKALNQPDEVKP